MRVAIYGAGSLGTVLGAYMSAKGCEVELYSHNLEHVAALQDKGAHIVGAIDFIQAVKAYPSDRMEGLFDYVFLMTKVLDNDAIARFLAPRLKADGAICTLQNGLPEPGLSKILGPERVLGCTVGWGATLLGPGLVKLTSSPKALCFSLGVIDPSASMHLERVKALLGLMGPVIIEPDFLGARWSKLLINASFSGMSTVTGLTFGGVCDCMKARRCALSVIKECIDVARASHITIAPVQGRDIVRLFDFGGRLKKALALALMPIAMAKHRGIRASMLFDLERGRRCEIDAIDGAVSSQGLLCGVSTPFTDLVIKLVHGYEKGESKPCLQSLDAFDGLLRRQR
ncbi:MAG: ketopantoate reductase C-terminal domain-containing protein [Sphaerochaetaceae bacterium]|jgi:2-dehydropantoate 2-reductase|nr:ketopantoate reductase C-terminal domain-containing protein [Sphaerochaetaceae bacterium]